ncbi:putative oxidoreductase [Solibacillus isronensis B3W22]|uniref:Putative oxidoreductase n=1 Tax=Solibacillus isronensis B3W22 TaxID=1224748 RepID=K1LMH4_9BACL|nr:SDR family oxidoreductase [Solibacillus isronensis]AMO86978.1 D-mannonate oxidoreductase [Solibacillus silvestris]EKB45434.1 putative oxidoreductase [Solibacillus isronensis B3W22]
MIPIHENLANKVAVITGGSGVLCSKMAQELARQQVKVAIIGRTESKVEAVKEEIVAAGGNAVAITADVLNKDSLLAAKEQILEQFGRIDFLINGAGGNHPDAITEKEYYEANSTGLSFFDLQENGFSDVFSLNFTGTFLACQVFGEALLQAENPAIINISSMSAYTPLTKIPAYSAAKAAINNFTSWMAVHFAETGLRVNAIAPGFFITQQNKDLLVDAEGEYTARSKKIIEATPMKRFGEPDQLLGALLFLLDSSYSSFITGTTIAVDGGFNAYSGV